MISILLLNNPTLTDGGYDPSTGKGDGTCVASHKSKVLLGGSGRCSIGFRNKPKKEGKFPGNITVSWFYNDDD